MEKPKDFQEWIKVESASNRECYYYNVLTGTLSWMIPTSLQIEQGLLAKAAKETSADNSTSSKSKAEL